MSLDLNVELVVGQCVYVSKPVNTENAYTYRSRNSRDTRSFLLVERTKEKKNHKNNLDDGKKFLGVLGSFLSSACVAIKGLSSKIALHASMHES